MLDPSKVKAISMVFWASRLSCKLGFTSTSSILLSLPVAHRYSQIKFPSLKVNPPLTAVPVLGAKNGSKASIHN
jgi:hypothetical protein